MQNIQTKNEVISKAILRYVRVSPFKVRRVVREIKGRSVAQALIILKMMNNVVAARILAKVIASAQANAVHNVKHEQALKIENILVDQALIMKRSQPRSRGRAFPIKKRLSHVAVFLTESKE